MSFSSFSATSEETWDNLYILKLQTLVRKAKFEWIIGATKGHHGNTRMNISIDALRLTTYIYDGINL